jgi:hypothetical protein
LLTAAPLLAEGENTPTYSIAAIDYAPTPLQKVGSVKAGLLCLPKGKLRWRDVARPGDHALVGRVEDVLRTGGLRVAPQPDPLFGDAPPATTYRIKATVEDVRLRLCVAGDVLLIGKVGRAPSTQGVVAVRWETYDRVRRVRIHDVRFDVPVDDRDSDARTSSGVLSNAIEASAARYAVARRQAVIGGGMPVPGSSTGAGWSMSPGIGGSSLGGTVGCGCSTGPVSGSGLVAMTHTPSPVLTPRTGFGSLALAQDTVIEPPLHQRPMRAWRNW